MALLTGVHEETRAQQHPRGPRRAGLGAQELVPRASQAMQLGFTSGFSHSASRLLPGRVLRPAEQGGVAAWDLDLSQGRGLQSCYGDACVTTWTVVKSK